MERVISPLNPSIMLIKRASNESNGFGEGFDIIVPAGWATPFWRSLIYAGAHSISLKDYRVLSAKESSRPCFPFDWIDTCSYHHHKIDRSNELLEKYLRKPSSKKPNYISLGTNPFFKRWDSIGEEKLDLTLPKEKKSFDIDPVHNLVLENKIEEMKEGEEKYLYSILERYKPERVEIGYFVLRGSLLSKFLNELSQWDKNGRSGNFDTSIPSKENCFIYFKIHCKSGVYFENAHLYLPEKEDLENLEKNCFSLPQPSMKKKKNLLLRKCVGYVTGGGFSFKLGIGSAIGLMKLQSFIYLLNNFYHKDNKVFALIRNVNDNLYRSVLLTVLN